MHFYRNVVAVVPAGKVKGGGGHAQGHHPAKTVRRGPAEERRRPVKRLREMKLPEGGQADREQHRGDAERTTPCNLPAALEEP